MRKSLIVSIALLVVGLIAGIWITRYFYQKKQKEIIESQSTVMLEKVREVLKLVTIEGNVNQIYNESNIRQATWYLPFPTTMSFEKTAILEVRGKVLVGYDLEKMKITADSASKTLTLSNLPEPEILAIDHQIEYRNLDESWFNSFTPQDYTLLNKNAREFIRTKALEDKLLDKAREQGNKVFEVITFMAESVGWKVVLPNDLIDTTPRDTLN